MANSSFFFFAKFLKIAEKLHETGIYRKLGGNFNNYFNSIIFLKISTNNFRIDDKLHEAPLKTAQHKVLN